MRVFRPVRRFMGNYETGSLKLEIRNVCRVRAKGLRQAA